MNDAYYTTTGERPDLADIEVNPPEGYIGARLYPIAPLMEKSAVIYYATVTADSAAQTGRAAGSAPTATQISNSSATVTPAERVRRGSITPDEAKSMGGIERADMVGAKWAKRQVQNALETSIAAETLGGTVDATFDVTNALTDVQTAKQAVRRYEGRTVVVSSTTTLNALVQNLLADDAHFAPISRTVSGVSPDSARTGLSFEQFMASLAVYFGVDEVLAGDDAIWNAGTNAERLAVCRIDDDPDELSHKWKPVMGKTFQYVPDGTTGWVVKSIRDDLNVNNHYDAYQWYAIQTLNADALYLFDGIQP